MTNQNNIDIPRVKTVHFPIITDEIPEIINVNYDLWTLRVTLKFCELDRLIYVTFKNVFGFRVLDEGDLLEFWNPQIRVSGWIWDIENGGWFDLEKLRQGFVQGYHDIKLKKEYLVLGNDSCLSVITTAIPEIQDSE